MIWKVYMAGLDKRILKITININGRDYSFFEPLNIKFQGRLFGNDIQADATVTITNLTKEQRNFLITSTSPFLPGGVLRLNKISVYAGRASVGSYLVWNGEIVKAFPTQRPDIGVMLTAKMAAIGGAVMTASAEAPEGGVSLRSTCQQIAKSLGFALEFRATEKMVDWHYSGSAAKQVAALNELGGIKAWLDRGNELVVTDIGKPAFNSVVSVNKNSGLIGVPSKDERGVAFTTLLTRTTLGLRLGCKVKLTSSSNPVANGIFTIYQIDAELTTREKPFYYSCLATEEGLAI